MRDAESGPLLYGVGADGVRRYIEDVERGEDCGCFCPDPRCNQPLVAKKGHKRAHHFAHKRGTCEWAVEYVISTIAAQVIMSRGCMVFPELTYYDSMACSHVVHARSQQVGISSVKLVEKSGRGNPDLLITRSSGDTERRFLAVISLAHPVKAAQIERIKATGEDAFLIDLKQIFDQRRREDKHFDRKALPLEFQRADFLASVMVDGDGRHMRWIANAKRDALEGKSKLEHEAWRKQEERRRKEEEERRRRQAEERRAEAERQRRELAEKEARIEAEKASMREASIAAEIKRIVRDLDQQDRQVVDSFGNRWVRCEKCGKASTVDDFRSYGGIGRINLGICYECDGRIR